VHPILAERRRLALYLLLWVPVAALLATLLARIGGLPAAAAAGLAFCLAAVYAFVCLGVWYACRALPLTAAQVPRAVASHAFGALLTSGTWVTGGRLAAAALGRLTGRGEVDALYAAQMPVLFAIGVLLYLLAAAIHYLVLALAASREAERRALELRALAREAELRALRAQIDPHFLFNSLNAVSALTTSDPAAARAMCLELSDFLRATLQVGARERIPLADELALVRSFLTVEKTRFGARLTVEERVEDAARACPVPPLLLQPLVENAVRHGIAHLVDGGAIRLAASVADGRLRLAVDNPADPERPRGRAAGVGLANVRARLQALYGPAARCETAERDGRYRVEISLPLDGVELRP
jgi:two-component system, LytTR family, sensor histidine kinase AlgZ